MSNVFVLDNFLLDKSGEGLAGMFNRDPEVSVSQEAGFSVGQMLWLMAGWDVSTVCFLFPSLVW